MPITVYNDFAAISLAALCQLMREGFSVLKTPHVGNQHPSNLVCASLGIPLNMVSFTLGARDKNFHPHLRISHGTSLQLTDPTVWTPFATLADGTPLEAYHQASVRERFRHLSVSTDWEVMLAHRELAAQLLRIATSTVHQLWYRRVDHDGSVTTQPEVAGFGWKQIELDVFRFTNASSGWIVPNRVHLLFHLVRQSLESERDVVYHLSGPQLVGYIEGIKHSLGLIYDALRNEVPSLPRLLKVYIVPVASCRFVTVTDRQSDLDAVIDTIKWYESLPPANRRLAKARFAEALVRFPECLTPIETATYVSQYDLAAALDLYVPEWLLTNPLTRVNAMLRFLNSAQHKGSSGLAI
jgi:hypothetical protein